MIEKKDWETAKTQFENLLVNAQVNVECYLSALKMIKKKLSEFADDKKTDPMPDEVKEIVKEMVK